MPQRMKTYKIYTAGKMNGLAYDEQMDWRWRLEIAVRDKSDNVLFVHPPRFYRYGANLHKTEREAMQWDLSQIRDSDIVVVDLSTVDDSIGTHMELGFIEAINQAGGKHIHVIGIGDSNSSHPWIDEVVFRHEDTVADAADYIAGYLLL